ncbi:MAG: hypothetical protein J5826_08405, partial [Bacteroidales bacterium]|nr:hypothetical protein [Bacteroidales bacterium]
MKFYFDKKPIDKILHQIRYCRVCTTTFFVPVVCADTSLASGTESGFAANFFSVYSLMLVLFVIILAVLAVFIIH